MLLITMEDTMDKRKIESITKNHLVELKKELLRRKEERRLLIRLGKRERIVSSLHFTIWCRRSLSQEIRSAEIEEACRNSRMNRR